MFDFSISENGCNWEFFDGDYQDAGCELRTATRSLSQRKQQCDGGTDRESLPVALVLLGFLVDPLRLSSPEYRREARVNSETSSHRAQGIVSLKEILSR